MMRVFSVSFLLALGSLQTSMSAFSWKFINVPGIDMGKEVKKTSFAMTRKLTCAKLCTEVSNCTAFVYRSNKECIHINEKPSLLNIPISSGDQYMVIDTYVQQQIIGLTKGKPVYFNEFKARYRNALNDGVYNADVYASPYCTSNIRDTVRPWIIIDMETESTVVHGKILPRSDGAPRHLTDFSVHVGDISDPLRLTENDMCYHHPGSLPLAEIHKFNCTKPVRGRYVYLSRPRNDHDMVVCEFEVFGWN